ncbi:MAG: hypothetical protein WDO13_00090 [Verrucomicrobiota bacterium]
MRGSVNLPGCGTSFTATKYAGAAWPQLVLEIADYIRGLNAIDPNGAVVPFAAGDGTGLGRGFVVPLTASYGTGKSAITLRGLGRCPTLSSLTLVLYVSGFGFSDGSHIDYDETPDADGSSWATNFAPSAAGNRWAGVTSERVRAFLVPCTFQPGCGFPEVSDACEIQIQGLDALSVSSGAQTNGFGFPAAATSLPLGAPPANYPAEPCVGRQ